MNIHVKNTPELVVPQPGSPKSAGYDVVALAEPKIVGDGAGKHWWKRIDYLEYRTGLFIAPQSRMLQPVDLKMKPVGQATELDSYHTLVFPRSSVSKYNLLLANSIGLIDNDYRGEIILRFKYIWQPEDFGFDTTAFTVKSVNHLIGQINVNRIYNKGDKIGQLVAEVTNPIEWMVVADLTETVRGAGGFGSTDNKPAEKFPTPIISESELIRIRSAQPTISEPTDPQQRKYDPEKPFSQTGKSSILEKWKANVQTQDVVGYEKLVKERETSSQ